MDELPPSVSGSVTILNEQAARNESEIPEFTASDNSSEKSTDGLLLQTLDPTASPSISVLSEFYAPINS